MSKILSVSELNSQIKSLLEATFLQVSVKGEISNLTLHSSGHTYFSIKDDKSSIRCILFRGNAKNIELKNGLEVTINGAISLYTPRGEYQIIAKDISVGNIGNLAIKYEELKNKLRQEGLFERKRELPQFPKKIALLTSNTGAALQDMLRVAQKRWNLAELVVINTLVQGEEAKNSIIQNLSYADSFFGTKDGFDIIVLARGGGSIEDLWAFNEESVARAIFQTKTIVVSAIGHEIDFVISDFVADLRAPTPSACMEMILPDKIEFLIKISELRERFENSIRTIINNKNKELISLKERFENKHYKIDSTYIDDLRENLTSSFASFCQRKQYEIERIIFSPKNFLDSKEFLLQKTKLQYEANNPSKFCQGGYAQITIDHKITRVEELKDGDIFELTNTTKTIKAKVLPEL